MLPGADVGRLRPDCADPVLHHFGDELWAVVGADIAGYATQDEQVGQDVDHVDGLELAVDVDRQALMSSVASTVGAHKLALKMRLHRVRRRGSL
jgi:hypothetical protein